MCKCNIAQWPLGSSSTVCPQLLSHLHGVGESWQIFSVRDWTLLCLDFLQIVPYPVWEKMQFWVLNHSKVLGNLGRMQRGSQLLWGSSGILRSSTLPETWRLFTHIQYLSSASTPRKKLYKIGIISPLKLWWNSPVNLSGPGAFCFGRLLIINSIYLIDISLFRLSISSCVCFGSKCLSRKWSR